MDSLLLFTAASLGVFHTAIGVDHYIPFVAMSKSNGWSYAKTMLIVFICGIGHVLSSVILGLCGVWFGSHVSVLIGIESFRSEIATWFLIAFGLVYMLWVVRNAIKNKPHRHIRSDGVEIWHDHDKGHAYNKGHAHVSALSQESGHAHESGHSRESGRASVTYETQDATQAAAQDETQEATQDETHAEKSALSRSFWPLFVLLVLGPCEPLIPLLIYPAAEGGMMPTLAVAFVFSICTIATMILFTTIALKGVNLLPVKSMERYAHALAGFAIFACGLAVQFLGI